MRILINVVNQRMKLETNLINLVSGTQRFIEFKFIYGEDWASLTTFAQFTQGGNSYNEYLDENGCCYLPPEIEEGLCTIMLFGTKTVDSKVTKATTNVLEINVLPNMLVADASSTEITQTLYDQLVAKVNELLDLSNSDYSELIQSEIASILADYLSNGDLAEMTIGDGTIEKVKLNSSLQSSIEKADNSWQKSASNETPFTSGSWESIYDPVGYGKMRTPVDPYSFAQGQDNNVIKRLRALANVADVESGNQTFQVTDSITGLEHTYNGLDAALLGIYALANSNASAILSAGLEEYIPFNILIKTRAEMDALINGSGAERTFYLVPKDNGYEKYWYVKRGEDDYVWDSFGSSSTVVLSELPSVADGEEDIDYIIGSGTDFQYYKLISGQWVLIAGNNFETLGYDSQNESYRSYLFGIDAPSSDTANEDYYEDGVLYLNTANMTYYSVELSNGTYSWVSGGTLVSTPNESKDYFVKNINGTWGHFRYIDSSFTQVGSSAYSRDETDEMIDELSGDISEVASNVAELQTIINNLANMVVDVTINAAKDTLTVTYVDGSHTDIELDTGVDIDSTAYNVDNDYKLHFYDSNGNELEDLAVEIRGGGGGGSESGGTVTIGRVTPASVQTIYGDDCQIEYTVIATDSSGEGVGDGVGTLYINNVPVESGFTVYTSTVGASNTINVGEYLAVGTNTVKIGVSVDTGGEANTVATKTWTAYAINMYFSWNYTDNQVNTSAVTDYYTPYGALSKTIYTFIDVNPIGFNPEIVTELPDTTDASFDPDDVKGINYFVYDSEESTYTHYVWDNDNSEFVDGVGSMLNVVNVTRSGVQQSLTIPMQTHGSHTIVRYMTGDVNGVKIKTKQQVHDMIFAVSGNSTPIIATSFNTASMVQYNTVQIPIVVYNPSNPITTVTLKEDGVTVSTWQNVDRTVHYWNYSPTTYGTKTLTITCGETTKTIIIEVEELDIDEAEVTGYDFRFKASEMATNDAVKTWSATYTPTGSNTPQTVDITFSNNFDWVNGGLHTETDEDGHLRQFFVVRAGTTATFNYNLFGQAYDPKQYGKSFKFIFKAVNCRTYDANVLTCMDSSNGNNGVGLVMTANEALLTTANNSIKTYYCKDSYIEFEANIHPSSEYRYLQFWMDGSHDVNKLYDSSDSMQQVTPVGITVGSPNCDVYIYMIKAYPTYLTNDNELSNFIMDAPNAYEMVDRYDRNDVLNASNEVDYTLLANKNPDLHIICLDLNRMSTGKKDNVVAYTVRHIYNAGGQSKCFTVNNACVTVQGTSSVGYLESAGNVDINFKYNRTFTSDNESYTTSAISFDDGTSSNKGFSLTDDAIAVDYINVKLNVASSENANNACIADWYNTYQPWTSPARKKNSKARDTMQFVPGAIFIRDRSGGLFKTKNNEGQEIPETTGYHFYGICDIGNSKKNTKVFHDTSNPMAVCMEVSNNTSLPCLMQDDDYIWNADDEATITVIEDGETKTQTVFEFRYVADGMENVAESNWDRFVKFMVDHHPDLATNNSLGSSVTFGTYTFKGSGTYDTSDYDGDNVCYLYGYGLPTVYNGGLYSASTYITDDTADISYYYINYSNNYIYSSNGSIWTAIEELTWTSDRNNVLAGTSIGTYAGTYTTDSYNYRMAYLLEHCEEYMIIDPVMYHFVFIESFLMTDNVAKNTFWSSDDGVHWEPAKDYDNDTALGNDNVGGLSFTYGLETDDTDASSYVFNAHDAAWITFARGIFEAAQTMYRNRESAGCFNTANFLGKVSEYQATRPERVWVADAQRKYLRPYEDNGTETYLPMLAGRKTHQREQVKTYNSYYFGSKYVSDFCTSQNIMVRGNTPTSGTSITVVPPANTAVLSMYINCYIVVASTSYNVVAKTKAVRGQTYTMDFSTIGSMGETELYFCTAPMITELSGLAHLYFKQNNFSMGTNLQRLEIGSSVAGYENPNLESLTIGNNKMLEYLDVRNCPNATGALDLSGCISLSEVYLENTGFTGITFATSGLLETAHLPEPTSITIRELIYVEDLTLESVSNLTTLRIENCDFDNSAVLTIGETSTAQSAKDITLNLVDSSSNLSRVRLVGLDWIIANTDPLDRLLRFAGIDDDSYDISQSVVTGNVHVPVMRSGLLDRYNRTWDYLTITYDTMIAQHQATFMNADGTPILDKRGNAYVQWVDSGSAPYDPITMGYTISVSDAGTPTSLDYDASDYNSLYYLDTLNGFVYQSNGTTWESVAECDILTPTIAATAQYTFTFDEWDDINTGMSSSKVITATYTSSTRTYTVTWYKSVGVALETQTDIPYGTEVNFSGNTPTWTDNEQQYVFRLFNGWNRSTGYITEDTNVYAIWEEITGLPSIGTDMSNMSPVQIYGIGQAGQQANYFDDLDYTDITLGHDFDFLNVEADEIGTDVQLTGIQRDTFVSGGYYFDGSHAYKTDILLFSEDSPSFTMAIDFQFNTTETGATLISNHEGNTAEGFRIYYNGSVPTLQWGDKSQTIGYGKMRDIVVIRHQAGSKHLHVYHSISAGNNTSSRFSESVQKVTLLRTNATQTDEPLSFGAVNYSGTGFRNFGKGTIHWCKIWYSDLGDEVANMLAQYPHETLRMEYWGAGKYYYANSNITSKLSFISNNQLGNVKGRGMWHRTTNTNVDGWDSSLLRDYLNDRFLKSLPIVWQSAIKQVEIRATAGNKLTTITTSYDYVYVSSYLEAGAGVTSSGYVEECGTSTTPISWLTSGERRVKFRGKIRKYSGDSSAVIYTCASEPAELYETNIAADSIWIHTGNSNIGYIFVTQAELDQYGITADIASDSNYANGGWVFASYWWLRSPNLGNATGFWYVYGYGALGNGYYASYVYGVVPCFSI